MIENLKITACQCFEDFFDSVLIAKEKNVASRVTVTDDHKFACQTKYKKKKEWLIFQNI